MQPIISVRQPVIAGARRQQLSELLRRWRRQPRKRSRLLFWALLSCALISDSGVLILGARLLGVWNPPAASNSWLQQHAPIRQALFSQAWPALPDGAAADFGWRVQVLVLLAAYAALALAWGAAVLTLVRILLTALSSERLRRLATFCVRLISIGVMLLAASALMNGVRAMEQGFSWGRWNAQAVGTVVVLPGCAILVSAWRRGWLSPFRLLAGVALGFTFLAMIGQVAGHWRTGGPLIASVVAVDAGFYLAGLLLFSLAAHAALRFYFGKQRLVEA